MLSTVDLERLIAVKKLEIEKEKTFLGLSSPDNAVEDVRVKDEAVVKHKGSVNFSNRRDRCDYNVQERENEKKREDNTAEREEIPADLERYIRRYLGLPVMLKAGEFSPNNPLVRTERATGDVLLGLGEYERRRNTLRKLRQQQYREYLDQQAKKKQEAKEQADKERREREEKERELEEREREREREEKEREREKREREREEKEREREKRERKRETRERERRQELDRDSPERRRASVNFGTLSYNKVDTGVQVDCKTAPLSVAVQTDDSDLFRLPTPHSKSQLTQAERELSPHTVLEPGTRASWTIPQDKWKIDKNERRRSYGDFDERSSTLVRKSNRDKLASDPRHSFMPSIFDADAIQLRNMQAEKEAAARRQFYQQELKNQIMEQQRIREERKTREKMLEAAEMRRLEDQLRMLRAAQDTELQRQQFVDSAMKDDKMEYDKRRKELQKDIEDEQMKLIRAPLTTQPLRRLSSSRSDNDTKLPYYYPLRQERNKDPPLLQERSGESAYRLKETPLFKERVNDNRLLQERIKDSGRKPFSTNIPDDSIFSPNYDVDGYLRRNLNFKAFEMKNKDFDVDSDRIEKVERVPVHELPKVKPFKPIPKERKSLHQESVDSLPIPVLRHSPVSQVDRVETGSDLSEAMKKVDDKWKVPVVQKNILKTIPNEEGRNVNILTQLGSIRRQLQLEQLKLDGLSKDEDV